MCTEIIIAIIINVMLWIVFTVTITSEDNNDNANRIEPIKCFIFSTIIWSMVFASWFIPFNVYSTSHHSYYYNGDLPYERECQLYDLVEDSKLIRDYIKIGSVYDWGEDKMYESQIVFSTRTHDHDHLEKALSELNFKLYSTKDNLDEARCQQKGPEYEMKFDG